MQRVPSLAARAVPVSVPEREAQEQRERARAAFSRFDYGAATGHLREALALLRPLAADARNGPRLAELHLELAVIVLAHAEPEAARTEVVAALHLDPEGVPDPGRFPPELVELHRVTREQPPAVGALRVESDPAGAVARLDGRDPRATPADWPAVPAGLHYVAVEREGQRAQVEVVTVEAGATTRRDLVLPPADPPHVARAVLHALEGDGRAAERPLLVAALQIERADVLVLAEVDDGRARLSAFDARGSMMGAIGDVPAAGGGDAADWLDEVLPSRSARWYGQWWFWTPVSLVTAAAAAGLIYLAVRTPDVTLTARVTRQ